MHKRETERAQLKRKLLAGVSINMPAPRRIGKTWTMNRLAIDLKAEDWVAVEVDVEGVDDPTEFSKRLCKGIEAQLSGRGQFRSHLIQRFQNLIGGGWSGNPLDALAKVDPIEFLDTLIAMLNETEEKSVILIDEIAYFFLRCAERDQDEAYKFAYSLRRIQQGNKNVRWLLTGSIGLSIVAQRFGLGGAFVDFETFSLHPFNKSEARSFLRDSTIQAQISHIFDASDDDFDRMFDELGWLAPYYLKLVANHTIPSEFDPERQIAIATFKDFEAAFFRLLQPGRSTEFAVWREHIEKNLVPADQKTAIKILDLLSHENDGETLDSILAVTPHSEQDSNRRQVKQVLAVLLNDGLICLVDARYQFRSGLVRRYWNEHEAE